MKYSKNIWSGDQKNELNSFPFLCLWLSLANFTLSSLGKVLHGVKGGYSGRTGSLDLDQSSGASPRWAWLTVSDNACALRYVAVWGAAWLKARVTEQNRCPSGSGSGSGWWEPRRALFWRRHLVFHCIIKTALGLLRSRTAALSNYGLLYWSWATRSCLRQGIPVIFSERREVVMSKCESGGFPAQRQQFHPEDTTFSLCVTDIDATELSEIIGAMY